MAEAGQDRGGDVSALLHLADEEHEEPGRVVDVQDLDASYLTSFSLYFFLWFGLNPVLQLLLGSNLGDDMRMMRQQMSGDMSGGMGGMPQNMGKQMQSMREDLLCTEHRCSI